MMNLSFGGFATPMFLVLCLLTGTGQSRLLQERTFADHEIEATAIYGFAFNGTAPESLSVEEMEDLLRLTENFYKRVFASRFARSYQDVLLSYQSHDWQKEKDTLQFSFDALVTFRELDLVATPSTEEVMDAMQNINTDAYLEGFVMKAQPAELFLWANYTNITASLKSEASNLQQTEAPIAAPTPIVQMEGNVVANATPSPSLSQPFISPTLPTQVNATAENGTVITVIAVSPQDQSSEGIAFGSDQTTASDQFAGEGQDQVQVVEKSGSVDGSKIEAEQAQGDSTESALSSATTLTTIPAFIMFAGYLLL